MPRMLSQRRISRPAAIHSAAAAGTIGGDGLTGAVPGDSRSVLTRAAPVHTALAAAHILTRHRRIPICADQLNHQSCGLGETMGPLPQTLDVLCVLLYAIVSDGVDCTGKMFIVSTRCGVDGTFGGLGDLPI